MKTKRPYADMLPIAQALADRLRPACLRIEIAGSLRRRKSAVGDIELCAIGEPCHNLFGEPTGATYIDSVLDSLGVTFHKNGQRYKQFAWPISGGHCQVDLFLAYPYNWGLIYMLRTGPGEFSRRFVTSKNQGGYKPDRYEVRDGRVWQAGKKVFVPMPEEIDLFRAWGMDWIEPEARA